MRYLRDYNPKLRNDMRKPRNAQKKKIIFKNLSYKINGIIFKVRKELGRYKNEKQYCDAIENRFIVESIAMRGKK